MASCGPENTDHRWHRNTVLPLLLSCRDCTGVWNPPPEIRAWVLISDALKSQLDEALAERDGLRDGLRAFGELFDDKDLEKKTVGRILAVRAERDALKVELERAQIGYTESVKTLDKAVKRVVELERTAPCRGCETPITRMFPAQCIECAQ